MSLQDHLYTQNTMPDVLTRYIEELNSSENVSNHIHANKLRSYKYLILDLDFLMELRNLFNDTYDFIDENHPYLHLDIAGRLKSLISVEKKILYYQSIGKSLDLINDLFAFRIILFGNNNIDLVSHCYKIAEEIIDFFALKGFNACVAAPLIDAKKESPQNNFYENFKYKDLIKDYICFPKANKYKSIHIVFVNAEGKKFEIQIRTFEMHCMSEVRNANHGEYKKKKYGDLDIDLDRSRIGLYDYKYYSIKDQIINFLESIIQDEILIQEITNLLYTSKVNELIINQIITLLSDSVEEVTLSKIAMQIHNFKDEIIDYAGVEHPLTIFQRQKNF